MSQGMGGVRQAVLPLLIHGKSRMPKRARRDLCGGRSVMVVPTATVIRMTVVQRRALREGDLAHCLAEVQKADKRLLVCSGGHRSG
jgi:hypothetical protein